MKANAAERAPRPPRISRACRLQLPVAIVRKVDRAEGWFNTRSDYRSAIT
jgi:hypothetical protein